MEREEGNKRGVTVNIIKSFVLVSITVLFCINVFGNCICGPPDLVVSDMKLKDDCKVQIIKNMVNLYQNINN